MFKDNFTNNDNFIFKLLISFIVFFGLFLSFYFYTEMKNELEEKREIEFKSLFESKTFLIENELKHNLGILLALKSYSNSTTNISRTEFRNFVEQFLNNENFKGLHAISWVPRVLHKDRKDYENRLKKELNYDFIIKQKDENGNIIYARTKADYFSVDYIEPYEINKKAQGYDISSNETRNKTLLDAKLNNSTRITGKIKLVQETQNGFGFLGVLPIFDEKKNLLGYYSAVFRINDIINTAIEEKNKLNKYINIKIYDVTLNEEDFLFSNTKTNMKETDYSKEIKIAGRTWKIVAQPTIDFFNLHQNNFHLIVLFFHLLIIILAVIILNYMNNKKKQQEQIVIMNSKLITMGEMIDIIAHQWSQPLSTISLTNSMNDYLLKSKGFQDDTIFENIENINLNIDHLKDTLTNFRNFARPDIKKDNFLVSHTLNKVLNIYSHLLKINSIKINLNIVKDFNIYGYENQFIHIFINLISNTKDAIKEKNITKKEIHIIVNEDEIIYRDFAGGIPANMIKDVFKANVTSKKEGTGMGMYMSKKIANNNNCNITVKNTEDGVEFRISVLNK